MNETTKKKKKSWNLPHCFLVVGAILVLATIMTWIIPAGQYERVVDEATGRNLVIADTFHSVEQNPIGPFAMFQSILSGLMDASDVIFFTMISYGYMCMLIRVGAFNAGMGALIRAMKGKDKLIVPFLVIIFSMMGATCGMYEEAYGFIPVVMGLSIALGYDGLLGAVLVMGSVGVGYAAAFVNPYTTAIAQSIAELPLFSGLGFRVVCYVVFVSAFMLYTMRYAKKVKEHPEKSYVFGDDFSHLKAGSREDLINTPMTRQALISLLIFFGSIVLFVAGSLKAGWYFNEISAVFIISMFIIGFVNKMGPSETCRNVVEIYKDILLACLVIGVARAILIVMQEGNIIDSVCYYLSTILTKVPKAAAACLMVVIQNLINFFIPSGSGQAATSMPIMTPLADVIGINRQIAVVAFQFGDGFSNLFWPTQAAIDCAIAGCALNKWYKFFAPLFLILFALEFVMIIIAVSINLGPF